MAKLAPGRRIVCPSCGADQGSIENLGLHLLDRHADDRRPVASSRDGLETSGRELLSKDAEVALGRLIQGGGPRAAEAKTFLVESNLRLVISIVMKRRPDRSRQNDHIQEGTIGLMRAAELFDPSKGFRFSTYATWWIRQAVYRGAENLGLVSVPESYKWKLGKARKMLSDGKPLENVASELGFSEENLQRLLNAYSARTFSIDQSIGGDEDRKLGNVLAVDAAPVPALRRDELASILRGLSDKERLVLVRRFGLDGKPEETLQEVSEHFGVSRERVRQIEQSALSVLKRRHERHGTLLMDGAFASRRRGLKAIESPTGQEAIDAAVARGEEETYEEAIMADLKCEKCPGMEFKNPQALGAHRRHEHPGTAKSKKGRKPRPSPLSRRTTKAGSNGDGGVFALALAPLRARREEILAGIPELREIDEAIGAIEKMQGGGVTSKAAPLFAGTITTAA